MRLPREIVSDNLEVNDYALRVHLVINTAHVYTKLASLQSEGHLLNRQVEAPMNVVDMKRRGRALKDIGQLTYGLSHNCLKWQYDRTRDAMQRLQLLPRGSSYTFVLRLYMRLRVVSVFFCKKTPVKSAERLLKTCMVSEP